MKFITTLILFLVLASSMANAQIELPQGCVTLSDSNYILKRPNPSKKLYGPKDSIYYVVREYICEDGREGAPRAPIGDSSVVMSNLIRNTIDLSRQWASAVVIAGMKNEILIKPVRTMNRASTALFNTSIYTEVAKQFPDSMLVGDYRIAPDGGTAFDATITKNTQGQFRLRWGTGTTNNKLIQVLSDRHIRILNYANNKDIDLVRRDISSPRWIADNNAIVVINRTLEVKQQATQSTQK